MGEVYESPWHPNYGDGLHLISSPIPQALPVDHIFSVVVDRAPRDGEWVKVLDPATQTYTLTTFHTGSGWDNGTPTISVGQAAWFDLGPVIVPEPSNGALLAFAFLAGRVSRPRACRNSPLE